MATRAHVVEDDDDSREGDDLDDSAWDAARPFSALVAALAPARRPAPPRKRPRADAAAAAAPRGRRRCGVLDQIHATNATSLLTLKVLPLLSAKDLGRFASAASFSARADAALGGRGLCDYVAWRRLAEGRRHITAPDRALRILHADTARCTLVVLRRRRGVHPELPVDLAAVRGAAQVARRAAALAVGPSFVEPRRTELRFLATEADAARLGVVVTDGVFLGARYVPGDTITFDLAPKDAARLGVASRNFDAELERCEVVVREIGDVPVLNRSPLRADGCWVLRGVDNQQCWSPEAYAEHVALAHCAGKNTIRIQLERAYDRRDVALPLSTPARCAVISARRAFDLDARADAALFACEGKHRRRAVCWTERDRATLEDHGARAGAAVAVVLVALGA